MTVAAGVALGVLFPTWHEHPSSSDAYGGGRSQTDRCAIKRDAYRREQVERPAALRNGHTLPAGWREVLRTTSDTFPAHWLAFVVDTAGHIVPCSVSGHAPRADTLPIARQLSRLRYRPAVVADRRVPQVVLLAQNSR